MGFQIGIKDIIDIILVALLLYGIFRLLKRSGMVNLFWGILVFILVWVLVSNIFGLTLTGAIFDRIISVGAIAIIVIFQDPIRTFFNNIGSKFSMKNMHKYFEAKKDTSLLTEDTATQIVLACKNMSQSNTGALIVITHGQDLADYAKTGEMIHADVSARMLEQIFYKNTPLHDGALFITNNKIASAACILPVSKNQDIPNHYGLRHRSALGMAEKSDAIVVVVSEETGQISVAEGNTIRPVKIEELSQLLSSL